MIFDGNQKISNTQKFKIAISHVLSMERKNAIKSEGTIKEEYSIPRRQPWSKWKVGNLWESINCIKQNNVNNVLQ